MTPQPPIESGSVKVRDAVEADIEAVLAIYNEVIATSTAVYMDNPTTLDERFTWWRTRVTAGYPVLIAEDESGVTGFASFGDFRPRPGYRFTVEHSVYVRSDRQGRGVGQALMVPLLEKAVHLGKHVVVAGVDADNARSLRFHERLGFERVAHFKQVGFKFDRWLDLVFLQLTLTDASRSFAGDLGHPGRRHGNRLAAGWSPNGDGGP